MLRLMAVLLALLGAIASPGVALANGGHIHVYGSFGVPPAVAWGLGSVLGLLFLWLITAWAISRRRMQREQGAATAPEMEDDHEPED